MTDTDKNQSEPASIGATGLQALQIIDAWQQGLVWILGPVLVGLFAVGLAIASEKMSVLNGQLIKLHPFAALLYMPAGFALLAFLCKRFVAGAQGSGIPQTIAATDAEFDVDIGYLLSLKIAIGKMLLTLGGLAVGASIGREGPTIQIGASLMHAFYGRGKFIGAQARRTLILAGGAAGIAAAFNTPLAGIMFAIEELSKKHVFTANSSTLVTIIVSGLISLATLGSYTYFGTTESYLAWNGSIAAFLLCGVVGGVFGGLFSRLMIAATFNMPTKLKKFVLQNPLWFAAICGLLVAIIGVASHGLVFGTGYQPTRLSLEHSVELPWYFGIAKFVATLLSAMSGIAGGIFAPSLAIGAGIGDNLAQLLPNMADHSAIVLLVMTAYLSGVTRAPVTSFIIAMEMTNNHQMLLPLMAASVVASRVSKMMSPMPLYHKLSEKFLFIDPTLSKSAQKNSSSSTKYEEDSGEEIAKYSSKIKHQPDREAVQNKKW